MRSRLLKLFVYLTLTLATGLLAAWIYFHPRIDSELDIGYSTRHGERLSYDVFTPANPNGAALIVIISGSWKSEEGPFSPWPAAILLRRGYTVFAVRHLSQPKSTVTEIVEDLNLAVRHIRFHSANYGIEKERFGVTGGSSGGHLALMLATAIGKQDSSDTNGPIDFESSAVQAAAVFFPVTDLVDLGPSTENPGEGGPPMSYVEGFGFAHREGDRRRIKKSDLREWRKMATKLSPIHQLKESLPPTLIIHGDADTLAPLDQSQRFLARANELGLGGQIELLTKKKKGHGWATMIFDLRHFADWFDRHLSETP